jgi:uroporphyrinogen-III synthase
LNELSTELNVSSSLPLTGKRILVTRAVQQAGKLSGGLTALGAESVEVPVLEVRAPDSYEPLDSAIKKLKQFNWLILTSANTVQAVAARCALLGVEFSEIELLKVAAVGSATAEAARKAGFRVTAMPEHYHSEGLVAVLSDAALGNSVQGKKVLLVRAKVARDVIPEGLTAAGAQMTVVDAYQIALPDGSKELLAGALLTGLDAATFTSSSSVRNLAEVAREAGIDFPLAGVRGISIGPVTSATMREFGWEPAAEAAVSDLPSLIEAVTKELGTRD